MSFSHHFGEPEPPQSRGIARLATRVWLLGLAALLLPVLGAWALRGIAYANACMPGAQPCWPEPVNRIFGFAFKTLIDCAWFVGSDIDVTFAIVLAAAFAAIIALRPFAAALTVLAAPLAALLLPIGLVRFTTYAGCPINETGAGDCIVWGTKMGMTFHQAATAPQLIYNYAPLVVAGAIVSGLLGWIIVWGHGQMHKTNGNGRNGHRR